MRLAIDTHHLLFEDAGTKRVTVNLILHLENMPGVDLVQLKPPYGMSKGKGLGKIAGYLVRFFWVHVHLPLQCIFHKADILLSPEFNTPLYTHCKRAVITHDAHIRAQKEFISPLWYYFYYIPFIEPAIRKADLIFTVSQFSKKQIVALMGIDEHKVHVVYNGLDKTFEDKLEKEAGSRENVWPGLVKNEYILFVGTFEARKNIERLIKAFAVFKKKSGINGVKVKLAIVGKPSSGKFSNRNKEINDLIISLTLENEIVLCGYVPEADLPALYRNACMIAFPSLYEGFGLPIIEGFASGVPVLTSNICSMPEIAGDAAALVDPYDVSDIAKKIEQLVFDRSQRERLISAGHQRVKEFTWKRFAEQIYLNIRSVVANKDN
jgi:glycosyltransferase involved in cell wall biosynthesis